MNRVDLITDEKRVYEIKGLIHELTESPFIAPMYIVEKLNIIFQGKYVFSYNNIKDRSD